MTKLLSIFLIISISCFATSNFTPYSTSLEYAQVTKVKASKKSNGTWCFNVSVRHNDTGWDHYADEWKIVDTKSKTLGVRKLAHPHVNEQPFTRSICGIIIPRNISTVIIKAKTNKHGYKGKPYRFYLKNN